MSNYRNPFEARCGRDLGPGFAYEAVKLSYVLECTYLPDFIDQEAKRIVEAKGLFDAGDRRKMLAVKRAYPEYTIEMWFTNPDKTISKASKTTYRSWCEKHGFKVKQGPRK
ncbi:phage endonuclease I [Sphingomonas sp. PP-CE-1A-559]|uniref:endodeoxyribonuclease n=1 Tax=Sphingomonas sp. PP-CE-1A-559 TaxID=2135657 RepID=UPI001056B4A0|nr:endodeoxyribonuclease [Sphingomonas sp. PP-CE-1A-559]TCP92731.1 phage endonuclease I [Sphingomonas sp. PP-CE-1A-559]